MSQEKEKKASAEPLSNRERAEKICEVAGSTIIDGINFLNLIEQALNEAEKRGAEKMRDAVLDICCGYLKPHPQNRRSEVSLIIEEKVRSLPLPGEEEK